MFDHIVDDVRTARETDPAAKSTAEVLLYAGLHAVWLYRIAHWLWNHGFRFTARLLSQVTRFLTGVEIHPAADLGRRVFIDHGMGVVIGETAEVGDDVNMYHGVTLGGDDPRPVKRHPTVEDDATLGANSTIVGDIVVGEGASVGAGAVVVDDVPAGATVVGNPARRVDEDAQSEGEEAEATERAEKPPAEREPPRAAADDATQTAGDDPSEEKPTTPPCCDATAP